MSAGRMTEWSKTPLAICIGVALVAAVIAWLLIAIVMDHKSALEHCSENGGSYNSYYKECTIDASDFAGVSVKTSAEVS